MSRVRDVNGQYAPEAGPELNSAIGRLLHNQAEPTHVGSLPARDELEACAPEEGDADADGVVYLVAMRGYVDAETHERRVVAEYVGTRDAYLERDIEGARLVHRDGEFDVDLSNVALSATPRSLRVDREECRHISQVPHVTDRDKEGFQSVLDVHADLLREVA